MANLSSTLKLLFSDDGHGFDMTLGDLAQFVDTAKARGAVDSDMVFPELEREVDVIGLQIHVDPTAN
ncbi:hypothetical protein [Arthrobacter sp. 18067]|uniref:hypothetical protein n=1 Tax=Arthrobacter sp. 18067 TaxID=2681413 RepID=UPI001356A61F|nr:hypothetical protein [Arthrobacter sp. 18067]